jgi:pSer/pThr/pTyr-binding forkhead associated (FHA) protein
MWILESNDPELVFRMPERSLKTVGRAPRADFVVDAPLVSRIHCRLSIDGDNCLDVEDLGSTNGTFVNGRKVRRASLRVGDTLKVGRVEFAVRASDQL